MSKLDDAIARDKEAGPLALYFGCWDGPAHHLHQQTAPMIRIGARMHRMAAFMAQNRILV